MALLDKIFKEDFRLSRGQASLIKREANVLSAVENRFAVFPRTIPFRPVYGGSLKRYSNEPLTKELENKLVKEIRDQLASERRVKVVRKISIDSQQSGELKISVEAVLIGQRDNLQFDIVI